MTCYPCLITSGMMLYLLTCGEVPARPQGQQPETRGLPQDEVAIERDAALQETSYKISSGNCRICWTVYESETNRGVVRHRSECGLALSEQAPLIGKLLRSVLASGVNASELRTVSWGRIFPDGARETTLSTRLVLAASRAADWDSVRGLPRGGDINGWVRKLANEASVYDELRAVFRDSGLEIRLAAVEKVLVMKAKMLPFFPALRDAGIRAEEKVPFDCQAWFSVKPSDGSRIVGIGAGPR